MQGKIIKKDDFFGEYPENRRYINLEGVSFAEELPLCYAYDHVKPPIGRAFNIHIEDEELLCEVELFDHAKDDFPHFQPCGDGNFQTVHDPATNETVQYRLGGWFNSIVESVKDGKRTVEGCVLREVSLIPEPAWPMSERMRH